MKQAIISLTFASLFLTACAHQPDIITGHESTTHAASHHAAHWGYEGESGPSHWGEISDEFKLCSTGEDQSPINIVSDFDVTLPAITFNDVSMPGRIVNNGHTIQVDIAPGSSMTVAGKTFDLKQFHFHTPSENTINGKSFPLEAHYVHHNAEDNSYAVVSVMFIEGAANTVLDNIWAQMPATAGESVTLNKQLDYTGLRPADRDYYRFNGSFTTPPCTEGVYWHVLKKPLTASKEQIAKFLSVMHHPNNRDIQNKEARIIVE